MELTNIRTNTREVEFTPRGMSTGLFLTLRYESSEEVQKVMADFRAKIREANLKRKPHAIEGITARYEDDLRIAHVAGWRWTDGASFKGEQPDFSKRALKEMLNDDSEVAFFLKEFIDAEVGSASDFLEK